MIKQAISNIFIISMHRSIENDNIWESKRGIAFYMDPCSGNATIGYARLNVKCGQKRMWERTRTRHEELGG
jgi:hypothetical protein